MLELAARVNARFAVLQAAASAVHVATVLYAELLSVPLAPVAFVHVAAFQVTAEAFQVTAPDGCVNVAALACIEIFNCLVAVANTIDAALTETLLDAVARPTLFTVNDTPAGTVTAACSATVAVKVVV